MRTITIKLDVQELPEDVCEGLPVQIWDFLTVWIRRNVPDSDLRVSMDMEVDEKDFSMHLIRDVPGMDFHQ